MRYLACIQYDGSNFFGFQRLKSNRSVQLELEKVLKRINKSEVLVKGAGRTDRGVHARRQMCLFDLDININELGLKSAMNSILPNDIYVNYVKEVDKDFHARFMVKKKIYTYVINMGEYDSISDKYLYNYCKNINLKSLKKAAKILIGKHICVHTKSLQLCLTLCDSMDYSPPVFSVHGILQARILEGIAMPFSRESS